MNRNLLARAIQKAISKGAFEAAIVTGVLGVVGVPLAMADESGAAESVEEVIVTGTPGGAEVRRFDANFAISLVGSEEIEQAAPLSTADLFESVPGVWVESSGGVSGANIFVRGLPSGGDADFVTVALNGMPLFPAPTLSFLENSTLFRVDETIERLEGLRGGPNPVFSNGQVGLTANFVLKEGSEETEGKVKYSTSDYGLQRVDGVSSGKLADGLYYMIGGYVSASSGVRDAGFTSEQGKQITANLTWDLENGTANLYHRSTDDHGTWYLPQAIDIDGESTNLPSDYTQVGPRNRYVLVPKSGRDGTTWETFDMGEGRGWKGAVSGLSLNMDLGNDWSMIEKLSITDGAANTLGFVPQGTAVTMGSINAGNDGETVSGAVVDADALVQLFGPWVVMKDIHAASNDISFTKKLDSFKFTGGLYSSSWDVDEWWSIGNQKWYELGHDGEQISSDTVVDACQDDDVETCAWKYDVSALGDGREDALYLAGEYYVGDVTVDVGVRSSKRETNYSVDDGALDGRNNFVATAEEKKVSYTAAVNWNFTDDMGAFVRINEGSKYPDFDTYRSFTSDYNLGSDLIIDVQQFELGYKLSKDTYSLYATAFVNEVQGQPFCDVGSSTCSRNETAAAGVELDGKAIFGDFSLDLNATIQDTEITSEGDTKGNQVQRQPELQVRLIPSYMFTWGNGVEGSVYATVSMNGDRYGDNANTNKLDGYTKVDFGFKLMVSDVEVQLAADNITDERGVTESDPRSSGVSANGRYILPRSAVVSVGYKF